MYFNSFFFPFFKNCRNILDPCLVYFELLHVGFYVLLNKKLKIRHSQRYLHSQFSFFSFNKIGKYAAKDPNENNLNFFTKNLLETSIFLSDELEREAGATGSRELERESAHANSRVAQQKQQNQ